jgi:hypothetical protein
MIDFIHCSSHEASFKITFCLKDIEPFQIIFRNFKFIIMGFRDKQIESAVNDIKVEMLGTSCVVFRFTKASFTENGRIKVSPQPLNVNLFTLAYRLI